MANEDGSYESLPPNFSLAANMLAGAFAGIAVCYHEAFGEERHGWLI